MKNTLAGLAAAIALAGCAIVHVHGAGQDDVRVTQRFGIVSLEVKPGKAATVVEATSLGVLHGSNGITVGYHNATLATLPPNDCRIVVWLRGAEQLKELQDLLNGRTDVCAIPPDDSSRRKL